MDGACSSTSVSAPAEETQGLAHAALTARTEFLETKNKSLTQQLALPKIPFRLADSEHNDVLIRFYAGFPSYEILLFFMNFLGQPYIDCSTGVVRELQNITKRNWIHLINFFLL